MVNNIFKNKRKKSDDQSRSASGEKRSRGERPARGNREGQDNGGGTHSSEFKPRTSSRKKASGGHSASAGEGKSKFRSSGRRSRNGGGGQRRRSGGAPRDRRNDTPAPRRVMVFDPAAYADSPQPEGAFTHLMDEIRNSITVEGYVTPTPIQEQAIPHILQGRDVLGCAQTGTGKTAAFVLPLLDIIINGSHRERELGVPVPYQRPEANRPKALVLAPTRELADQIGQSIKNYARFTKVSHAVVFGGVSQWSQVRELEAGVDILVATPGRLLDLINQRHIDLSAVEYFILDEVDRMLDMGFIPDIQKILLDIPPDRQTLFFSATLSRKVMEVASTMVRDAVEIAIEPEKLSVDRVKQVVYFVDEKNKNQLLTQILTENANGKAIIFTQMKHAANKLAEHLEKSGVRATAIHGNKSQAARTKALQGFKQGKFQILVATDVAARGLDVDDVTHVINYDMPSDAETYVHRIGRTARAGAAGDALSFCSAPERALLHGVERHLKQPVRVELDHEFHCEKASQSRQAAPKFGRQNRGGGRRNEGRGRRSEGGGSRNRRYRN